MSIFSDTVKKFKERLRARDAEAIAEIVDAYQLALVNIQAYFDLLMSQIETLQSQGYEITESLLYTRTRLQQTILQIADEIDKFNVVVEGVIESGKYDVIRLAVEESKALINAEIGPNLPQGYMDAFLHFDEFAVRETVARLSQERVVREILGTSSPQMAKDFRQIFVEGIIRGEPPKNVASQLEDRFNMPYIKAQVTARTEILTSYRNANIESYSLSQTVKAWQWSATLDDRTCPICIYLDGQVFSLDTPFASHPQCRCSPLPVTKTFEEMGLGFLEEPKIPDLGLRGEEWFKAQSPDKQEYILGKAKYDLFSQGRLNLGDLVDYYDHPVFGPSRQEKSLKHLKQK